MSWFCRFCLYAWEFLTCAFNTQAVYTWTFYQIWNWIAICLLLLSPGPFFYNQIFFSAALACYLYLAAAITWKFQFNLQFDFSASKLVGHSLDIQEKCFRNQYWCSGYSITNITTFWMKWNYNIIFQTWVNFYQSS